MKNKKLTYFLIAIVAGVWGLILYRVFAAVGADQDQPVPVEAKQEKENFNDFTVPKDTARLLLNYPDPFGLVKPKDTILKTRPAVLPRSNIPAVARPAMNWSFITYSGYIRNPSTKKLVALLTINGQNMTLCEGETRNQVKLLRNLRDSIKISYGGKIKFIPIKMTAP